MDSVLVKILAVALAFGQAATKPDIKDKFDPIQDQQEVIAILHSGCEHMRRAFDIEDVNIDDLITTAMQDPDPIAAGHAVFRGINIRDLHAAYRQFCKGENVADSPVDLSKVIEFYNRTLADLPDYTRLKGMRLPGASAVLDRKGERFAEVYEQDQRRIWVDIGDIPAHVQQAFVAAEDKRFYEHKGFDERALIRAFIGNLTQPGRPQGGSTITQQVVKNLLVGDELTYERKLREMVLAFRVERTLTKPEILELYLNSIFLGRASAGVEMAARSYFGKPARDLTLADGALLAGLTKGPNSFNPERYPDRAKARFRYVLSRMQEDGAITSDEVKRAQSEFPKVIPDERVERPSGSHFTDFVARELKAASGNAFRLGSYTIQSTINSDLQRATELALQEGLARYEMSSGRVEFHCPELNLAQAIDRIEAVKETQSDKPAWQIALEGARLPAYDVQWKAAVVIEGRATKREGSTRVGLADGRILPLQGSGAILRKLKLYDVVLVRVTEGRGRTARADLRVRPVVQGAVVILENKTGRILAMTGGFSYALSQLNRVTQSQRQPGSALKPLTYLAALERGLQPNTLVRDEDITLPPITKSKRKEDFWSPKNYEGGSSGIITMRTALENSRNLATANLLDGGVAAKPPESLDRICTLAIELQIYKECMRYYPFVLGAQPVRPIDLAVFYATIANEGARPTPYAIEAVERNGNVVYRHAPALVQPKATDRVAFYQLKTMLQGVVQHGTARRISYLSPYVAGKTGTTDDENDAWFVGFTNDVTVAVWVGYDNADGRRTLGGGRTGANVAVPIFEPTMQAVWAYQAPKTTLNPPSTEAMKLLATKGVREGSKRRTLVEYFRRDSKGRAIDTQNALISGKHSSATATSARNASAPSSSARSGSRASSRDTDRERERGRRQHTYRQAPDANRQAPPQPFWGWGGWGWNDQGSRSSNGRRDSQPLFFQRY